MNASNKRVLSLITLAIASITYADRPTPSHISFRSPSRDTAAKLVGTTAHQIFLPEADSYYGMFFFRPAYKQSFRNERIAECLFGDALITGESSSTDGNDCPKGTRSLKVSGSQLANRNNDKDLMAENFYLPRDFESTINFNPRVRSVVLDFHLYVGLDEWYKGMYCRIYAPYVHSRYDLRFSESEPSKGTVEYAEGFFSSAAVPVANLLDSFTNYARGDAPTTIPVSTINPPSSITVEGLKNAKITCGEKKDDCLGDLRFELGYNRCLNEDAHLGFNLQMAAPTGTRPKGEFLFAPQCGNNKHWEFGAGMTAHCTWRCQENEDRYITFWLEADITHMFRSRETRTLDVKEKPLSRYMLAMKLDSDSVFPLTGLFGTTMTGNHLPNAVFNGTYAPVANFSTQSVSVSASVQADVTAMFTFNCNCYSWDLGYNFWARSCEKVKFDDKSCTQFSENTWALKGDAQVYGFVGAASTNLVADQPIALSATQSKATIHNGQNAGAFTPPFNARIDNAELSSAQDGATVGPPASTVQLQNVTGNPGAATNSINTSIQPTFINKEDLDLCGAATRGISHKLFTHFNYTWLDCDEWKPYVGIGAEVEFGKRDKLVDKTSSDTTTSSSCKEDRRLPSDCIDCALTQWGVWLKAGWSFD